MFATNMTLFLCGSSKVRGQKGEEKTIAHKIKARTWFSRKILHGKVSIIVP